MDNQELLLQLCDQSALKDKTSSLIKDFTKQTSAGFDIELIPSLTRTIDQIGILLKCIGIKATNASLELPQNGENATSNVSMVELAKVSFDVYKDVCLPCLKNTFPTFESRKAVLVLLGHVSALLSVCVERNIDILLQLLEICLHSVELYNTERPSAYDTVLHRDMLDIHVVCEVIRFTFTKTLTKDIVKNYPKLQSKMAAMFNTLMTSQEYVDADVVGSVSVPVFVKVLQLYEAAVPTMLTTTWTFIAALPNDDRKQYILLCGLANFFLPVDGKPAGLDVRCEEQFWRIIQAGLSSKDSSNRKRSMYLIKRIVSICETFQQDVNKDHLKEQPSMCLFWWSSMTSATLSHIWNTFLVLMEVMEEKQVHVIKPLLPRVSTLIEATSVSHQVSDELLMHTSWLAVLFTRCMFHESLQIIRWSVENVLALDLSRCPMLLQGQTKFLCGPLLFTLRESKLFLREPGTDVGTQPEIAEKLKKFFPACWSSISQLDNKKAFLEYLLKSLCCNTVGPVSLFYVTQAVALLPPTPCINTQTTAYFRDLLTGYLVNVSGYLRGAVQCFLLQIFTAMLDPGEVTPKDFFSVLALFRQDECFQRGTTLWESTSTWLKSVSETGVEGWKRDDLCHLLESMATDFLQTTADSHFSDADVLKAQPIACFLLVAADAGIATTTDDKKTHSTLVHITDMLAHIINTINSHAYMSPHKADKAIQLLVLIVKQLTLKGLLAAATDPVAKAICQCIDNCQSELVIYLCGRVTEGVHMFPDISPLLLYNGAVEMLMQASHGLPAVAIDRLVARCIQIHRQTMQGAMENMTQAVKNHQLVSVSMLGTISSQYCSPAVCQLGASHLNQIMQQIKDYVAELKIDLYFSKSSLGSGTSSISNNDWGKVASLYQSNQWKMIVLALNKDVSCRPVEQLLDMCVEALSVSSGETAVPVFKCIEKILPQVVELWTDDQVAGVLESCWQSVYEGQRKAEFWALLDGYVQLAYQACLLRFSEQSCVLTTLLKRADTLIAIGEDRVGVANVLSNQLCTVLSAPGMIDSCKNAVQVLVSLCMFGSVHKRGGRQWLEVCACVERLGSNCSVTELKPSVSNRDVEVRATVISFLCKLDTSNPSHRPFVTDLVYRLIKAYKEVAMDKMRNYFSNTKSHRQKHRLVQCLVLLEGFILQENMSEVWEFVWTSLEQESQPSVRHLLEWMAVSIATRISQYGQDMLKLFDKYKESKNMVLCSLLCIAVHLGPRQQAENQEQYYQKVLSNILPWCMAHHFNTRIFAQAALVKLWEQCQTLKLNSLQDHHSIINTVVDFSKGNRNSTKNVQRLLASFFFKSLDLRRDFSIETLFDTLPSMTSITEEEWISPAVFVACDPSWRQKPEVFFISLHNPTDELKNSTTGLWKWRGGLTSPDEDQDQETAPDVGGEGDVQKKIMPWKQMAPDEETQQEIDYGVKSCDSGDLVVVTSLIDKIPNLGGLCRTSEIFGVSEFVLGKLQFVDDKGFQGLSVTAHKWLPITEVPESNLTEYLLDKRREGYTLVGVEQTANSVSLTEYQFPVKTLLLLGNEKEGIPVGLISLLDVCVEIPQQGVIRSLNVHVSGALLIWEYRRQQLVKLG